MSAAFRASSIRRSWPRQACSLPHRPPAIAADASPWDDDLQSAARLIAARAQQRIRRPCVPRRRRNQARAGLEDLLALSGRFRRAAGARFFRVAKRQSRHGALSGAAAVSRRRRRQLDRLQGRRDPAAARRAAGRRQAGDAAAQARLRGVREALRAGRGQARADADRRRERATTPMLGAAEARVPKPPPSATAGRLRSARSAARRAPASRASSSMSRRRPARRSMLFAEGPTAAMGAAGAGAGRRRAARACSASPSNSTGCRPARSADGATLRLTAVAGDKAIEVAFRLD